MKVWDLYYIILKKIMMNPPFVAIIYIIKLNVLRAKYNEEGVCPLIIGEVMV